MNSEQNQLFSKLLEELRSGFYTSDTISLINYGITDQQLDMLLAAIKLHSGVNAQIRILNLAGHDLNFTAIEGLVGLEELTLTDKKGDRDTLLALINLPRLKKLQARSCKLTRLTFENITSLEEINLPLNQKLTKINLDAQTRLTKLDLFGNNFSKLDLSALHKLQKVDVADNYSLEELYLGNSPLSEAINFNSEAMSENSKKQLWARYSTNAEQMHDYEEVLQRIDFVRTAEIKNTVRIKEISDLSECFEGYKLQLEPKLKLWMKEAQRYYAYCRVGYPNLPKEILKSIAIDYLSGNVSEFHRRIVSVFQQFETVVPEVTNAFIDQRVNPFIKAYKAKVFKNLDNPKLEDVIERFKKELLQDSATIQAHEAKQAHEATQNRTTAQESDFTTTSTGCFPVLHFSNIKPLTYFASGCKAAAQQSVKHFPQISRKKHKVS